MTSILYLTAGAAAFAALIALAALAIYDAIDAYQQPLIDEAQR